MDGSARDLQLRRNNGQWLLGKTLDTFKNRSRQNR
jgi:hypothetical protein